MTAYMLPYSSTLRQPCGGGGGAGEIPPLFMPRAMQSYYSHFGEAVGLIPYLLTTEYDLFFTILSTFWTFSDWLEISQSQNHKESW